MVDYASLISRELGARKEQIAGAIELLDSENTIPFIARYRKEATGGLDEEQLRRTSELIGKLRSLDERREVVLKSIQEQGKLTPELKDRLLEASSLTELEDLYQPFRPKRRTRASIAREKGLAPLADMILEQVRTSDSLEQLARPFLNETVADTDQAWAGASDIVAEAVSDHAEVRRITREKALQWGSLRSEKVEAAEDPRKVYELYYEYELRIDRLRPHQVLAINRGEEEKILRAKVLVPERDWQSAISTHFRPDPRSPLAEKLQHAGVDAAERLLLPAIERDIRRTLTERAEAHAIEVFAANLRALLNQPPLAGQTILGIDPGFRTGCKVAVVDPTGKLLDTATIYPHEPQKRKEEALKSLAQLALHHNVNLITIGNGTASRETEHLVAEFIQSLQKGPVRDEQSVKYMIVNEAGASVYSASPLARAELPDLDVSLRGAVSIARRAQDPLAELVKIEPKSIGVGLYQHDVDQKQLAQTLTGVVESVVNQVGVDANTASPALLAYVSGIGTKLAERIVAHRDQHGPFENRQSLTQVSGFGPKAFEQAAGFLRIRGGNNPLDASAIHPESYPVAETLLHKAGLGRESPVSERQSAIEEFTKNQSLEVLARELNTGIHTLADILEQLVRPGRDPRADMPTPILRSDVLSMDDLRLGMRMKGTVRNVVDFGAFIDIGVKHDGLLHRSQIPPGTSLKAGDVIEVEILKIETERQRIGLGWPGRVK
jgi:protein Tex